MNNKKLLALACMFAGAMAFVYLMDEGIRERQAELDVMLRRVNS